METISRRMENRGKSDIKKKYFNKEKTRRYSSDEMVFGTRAIIETIHAGKEIDKLFLQKGLKNELSTELIELAKERNIPFTTVPSEKLDRITKKNHQGSICFISAVQYASLDHIITQCYENAKLPLILVLDGVTDVRNIGAIARSAECMGVDAIVVPTKGTASLNSDAMKTSAGALSHIPVCREEKLTTVLQYLLDSGIAIFGATEKADKLVEDLDFNQPAAIIMGSEDTGISSDHLRMVSDSAKVDIGGKIASLNVSVAAGIFLYEAKKQRKP